MLDLETLANLSEVMRVFPGLSEYPGLTLKADINSIICAGYKWYGEKKINCINAWDFPKSWKKNVNDDRPLLIEISEIIKKADCIVTHNGKRFDWKVLQTRLYVNKMSPLPKIPHIDTRELAKRHLFLFNNRLNTVARSTGIQKIENGGWPLWEAVLKREKKAMRTMTKYCKGDVKALEAVFKKMLPYITNMPNHNLFRRDGAVCCHACGKFNLVKEGRKKNITKIIQQWRCLDCGSWSRTDVEKIKPRNIPKPL